MNHVYFQVQVGAVIVGLVVLGEEISRQLIGALALILTGLAVSQLRFARNES
jgi:drug/metabolite transporter (DMT)-like permease